MSGYHEKGGSSKQLLHIVKTHTYIEKAVTGIIFCPLQLVMLLSYDDYIIQ